MKGYNAQYEGHSPEILLQMLCHLDLEEKLDPTDAEGLSIRICAQAPNYA